MTGTALVSYQDRFSKDAQDMAAAFARTGSMISTKGGVFSLNGEVLGPRIAVVIVDSYYANEFHPDAYDADNPLAPICYAMARRKEDLSPHETMQADLTYFQPQHFPCAGCPQNEWGTAATGRGKACKNKAKLSLIPAGYYQTAPRSRAPAELFLFEEPGHFASADVASLSVSVTSVENWSRYVSALAVAHQRPPYAVFTEIELVNDPKTQFKMTFEFLGLVPDTLFDTLISRVDATTAQPFQGYMPPTAEQLAPQPPQARTAAGGLRGGLRR